MKRKILYVLTMIFSFANLYGQEILKKGTYNISGGFSFSLNSYNDNWSKSESKDLIFSPQYSYFISDNILVGLKTSFTYYETEYVFKEINNIRSKFISRVLSIGPSLRYYIMKETLSPFVETSFLYSQYLGQDESQIRMDVIGGLNYFLSDNVALEPFISYNFDLDKLYENERTNFSFGVRFQYFISR